MNAIKSRIEERVLKEIRSNNEMDIKKEINPLYSIAIGSHYESKEMLRDTKELLEAVALTFWRKGRKEGVALALKRVLENKCVNNNEFCSLCADCEDKLKQEIKELQ